MADHLDAPGLMPPHGNAAIDITDVYAFQKPGDSSKSILIMNVNPLTLAAAFDSTAQYELRVDTNADAFAEVAFRIRFSPKVDTTQTATVRRAHGPNARGRDFTGDEIFTNAPVSFGSSPTITDSGSYRFFAGKRSDPFFFDLLWFLAGLPLPHTTVGDFFADKNVFGIVLEVPNTSALGSNSDIGVWGRTLLPEDGEMLQVDRMGRPAINTVFMHGKEKLNFNRAEPQVDVVRFTDTMVGVLETLGAALGGSGLTPTAAAGLAAVLLPDILTYDYSSSSGFLNGRNLTDDVIDTELNLVTNTARTTDGVGAHADLLSTFPFLGTPH